MVSSRPLLLDIRGVSCAVSMSRWFGRLRVLHGEVVFTPEGRANSALSLERPGEIVHRDPRLTLVVGRFRPPWMNSGLVLVGASGADRTIGLVLLSARQRRAVVTAARAAGFEVTIHPTAFSAGGEIGSASELERFRRDHAT